MFPFSVAHLSLQVLNLRAAVSRFEKPRKVTSILLRKTHPCADTDFSCSIMERRVLPRTCHFRSLNEVDTNVKASYCFRAANLNRSQEIPEADLQRKGQHPNAESRSELLCDANRSPPCGARAPIVPAACLSEPTPHPGGGRALWGTRAGRKGVSEGKQGAPVDSKVTYINCSKRPPGGEQQTVSTRMTPVPVFGDRNEGWRGGDCPTALSGSEEGWL